MRNVRPVFLVGFARGGTNLALNLLRSHPDLVSPRGETHEVFRGKADEPAGVRRAKRLRYWPVRRLEGRDVFDPGDWTPRAPFHPLTRRWIDRVLFAEKLRARGPGQNRWKREGTPYKRGELARARLLCKNLNALTLLSGELAATFSDAHFVALVRDGFAVCEGQARRGVPLEEAARRYELGCRQIAADAERIPRFHLFRYEDLVASPEEGLRQLCQAAGVDHQRILEVRLETKPVLGPPGSGPSSDPGEKPLLWYDRAEFAQHFRGDANANQRARLGPDQIESIARLCGPSLRRFGYL